MGRCADAETETCSTAAERLQIVATAEGRGDGI
jgi:hypothetical protein